MSRIRTIIEEFKSPIWISCLLVVNTVPFLLSEQNVIIITNFNRWNNFPVALVES